MDSALAAMHKDVVWANGMEGGYVYGRDGVRTYWTRQHNQSNAAEKPMPDK